MQAHLSAKCSCTLLITCLGPSIFQPWPGSKL
uniref:Uncharacterized protein n=1 Tax=Rhizophora mucronata TaxID=61149 RepID=A0A2P2NG69_RHIMU